MNRIIEYTKVISIRSDVSENEIQQYLLNRNFISLTSNLLKELCNEVNKSNSKRFLLSYMIYHKILFNDNPTKDEIEIVEIANNMLNTLYSITSDDLYLLNIGKFKDYYLKYIEKYTVWANKDKHQLNTSLIHAHSELSNTQKYLNNNIKDNVPDDIKETQQELNKEITDKLNNIKERIKLINGIKNAEDIISTLTSNAEMIQDESILNIAKKAFWDIFTEEIEQNDYSRLFIILDEIKNRLKSFIPNRHDIHIELDKNIDISLYKQMIENNAFESSDFINLLEFLISQLKQYIAPIHDNDINEWVHKLYENIEDNYSKTLPSFFEKYYTYLDITEKELNIIKTHINKSSYGSK